MIRLEKVLKISLQDVLKTSSKHLEDVLKTFLQDVLKTSGRRMTKANILVLTKTSSEDVRLRRTYSSWSRRLQNVFIKTNVCWVHTLVEQIEQDKDTTLTSKASLKFCRAIARCKEYSSENSRTAKNTRWSFVKF